MKLRLLLIGGLALSCGKGVDATAPTANPCINGSGNSACVNGQGNQVTIIVGGAPTPTPEPGATPANQCILGPSVAQKCNPGVPTFLEKMSDAQSTIPPGVYTESTYVQAFVKALQRAGFCVGSGLASGISSDEVVVKQANTLSETYDVWNQNNTPQILYVQSCSPARF